MKSKSLTLFIISAAIFVSVVVLAIFWNPLGLDEKNLSLLGMIGTISFGVAIAGLVVGITEVSKVKSRKTWIGLVGNLIVTLFIVYSMIQALMMD